MPDNPNKKGADSKRVSQQSHEQKYQQRKARGNSAGTKNSKKKNETGGR